MKTKSFFIGLSVLVFTSVLSAAPNQNMASFGDFDLNSDGIVSASEFDQAKTERMTKRAEQGMMMRNAGSSLQFSDIDANKDGKFTQDEFRIAQQKHMQQNRMNNQKGGMKKGQMKQNRMKGGGMGQAKGMKKGQNRTW